MKLSNLKLVNDAAGLSQLTQKNLPVKVSYAIAKNITKIKTIVDVFGQEKQKLIDKYSVKGDDGKTLVGDNGTITIQQEFLEDWNSDLKELQEIENEIDIHKFDINLILNGNYELMPGELMLIDYMIEDIVE